MRQYVLEVCAFGYCGYKKRNYAQIILTETEQEAIQQAKELTKTEAFSTGKDIWRVVGAFLYQYTGKKILGLFLQRKCVANVSCANIIERRVTASYDSHLEFANP